MGAYEVTLDLLIIDKEIGQGIIQLWVDNHDTQQTPNSSSMLAEQAGFTNENECYSVRLVITDPEDVEKLTTYDYLFFKLDGSDVPPSPPGSSSAIVDAVMDNVTACELFNLDYSTAVCDQLCIELSSDCEPACDRDQSEIPAENDCYMQVIWEYQDGEDWTEVNSCFYPYIGNETCCFTPEEYGTYRILVDYLFYIDAVPYTAYYMLEIEHMPCSTTVITTDTEWDANSFSDFTRFQNVTVQSGRTLTIQNGLTIRFCEDGDLIIEPGGTLILNGVLTSYCDAGWRGVEVQGDGSHNQYPQNGLYPQGQIYCNAQSRIENAHTAVQLFGPELEDAGGMIYAEDAFFLNNSRGIRYAPFANYFPSYGNQKPYFNKIRNCEFRVDDHYTLSIPFREHIRMEGVFGLGIFGTYFFNEQTLSEAILPTQYGTGIHAINSGFNVGATAIDPEDEPCLPGDCNAYRKSTFKGLGTGISIGQYLRNKPVQVYNSEFEGCFFGVVNEGLSGLYLLFNDFLMGEVKELKQAENQVGISLSGYLQFGALQENKFIHTAGNADFTLGIVCNHLGEMSQAIRRNTFTDLHVGNEAFGINGLFSNFGEIGGLTYLCNENAGVLNTDFFIPNTPDPDVINLWQGQYGNGGAVLASGNTFSGTGDPTDGYFANYGDKDIVYFYDDSDPDQVPDLAAIVGVENVQATDPGNCTPDFCLPAPCLENMENANGNFSDLHDNYLTEIANEEYEAAAHYRIRIDSILNEILRYLESDTSSFNEDTLRSWYGRVDAVTGQLALAKDYLFSGDYALADAVIDTLLVTYPLTASQVLDMNRVIQIINILSARSVYQLTTTDIDSLLIFSDGSGASYAMSRSILGMIDTVFTPRYYMPGEINPRSLAKIDMERTTPLKITFYPNPAQDFLCVINPDWKNEEITYSLLDPFGALVSKGRTSSMNGMIQIPLQAEYLGILFIHLTAHTGQSIAGNVIVLK